MTARAAWLAIAALPLLSGCVVAALPVLAAGAAIESRTDGDDAARANPGLPRVPIDLTAAPPTVRPSEPAAQAQVQNFTLADGTRMEVMTGRGATPGTAPVTVPLAEAAGSSPALPLPPERSAAAPLGTPADARIVPSRLPPPSGSGPSPSAFASYETFYGYAVAQGTMPIAGSERRSALLTDPAALAPTTRTCSVHPAAVLIDLDPAGGVIDPAGAVTADPRLVNTLAVLRAQGVAIGWITAATADRAGAVRRALAGSGLDPVGRDELALLRYPEERKQTRREDFGKQFCVVAIAGDTHSDFDEVFEYLKDRVQAKPLEQLMGKGWFLIPQPLT